MAHFTADLIKPADLLPEFAARLEEDCPRHAFPPDWRQYTSWRALEEKMHLKPASRSRYRYQRHHYQQLTAEALTTAAAAADGKVALAAPAAPARTSSDSAVPRSNGNLEHSSSHCGRQYMPIGPTVCSKCGHEGHTSSSCSTSYCHKCMVYGHAEGQCKQACLRCGCLHPPYPDGSKNRCVQFRCHECNLFGHKVAHCPTRQCSCCSHYGHIAKDCPACPDCWTYHQEGMCPGYCQHCDALGHWTADCINRPSRPGPCSLCGQQGHVSKHCSNSSHTSRDGHQKRSARSAPAGNSSSNNGQQQGSGQFGSVHLLPVASEEENVRRRVVLMDTLMSQVQEYAMCLLADEQKLSVLSRLAPEDLQAVLQQEKPEQQLDDMYASWQSSELGCEKQQQEKQQPEKRQSGSSGGGGGSGNCIVRPNQLPDHIVSQMEASLPPGVLPDDWSTCTSWREVDELLKMPRCKTPPPRVSMIDVRRRFRDAKNAACAAASAELMAEHLQHPQQQQQQQQQLAPAPPPPQSQASVKQLLVPPSLLLPEHAAAMEASLPPGLLPQGWQQYKTWNQLEVMMCWAGWELNPSELRKQFRELRQTACDSTVVALAQAVEEHDDDEQLQYMAHNTDSDMLRSSSSGSLPGQEQQQHQQHLGKRVSNSSLLNAEAPSWEPGQAAAEQTQPLLPSQQQQQQQPRKHYLLQPYMLLPEFADAMEEMLPVGLLPEGWREYRKWRDVYSAISWVGYGSECPVNRNLYKQFKVALQFASDGSVVAKLAQQNAAGGTGVYSSGGGAAEAADAAAAALSTGHEQQQPQQQTVNGEAAPAAALTSHGSGGPAASALAADVQTAPGDVVTAPDTVAVPSGPSPFRRPSMPPHLQPNYQQQQQLPGLYPAGPVLEQQQQQPAGGYPQLASMVPAYPSAAGPALPGPAAQSVATVNSIRPATLPEHYAQQLQVEFADVLPSDWREFSSWRSLEAKLRLVNADKEQEFVRRREAFQQQAVQELLAGQQAAAQAAMPGPVASAVVPAAGPLWPPGAPAAAGPVPLRHLLPVPGAALSGLQPGPAAVEAPFSPPATAKAPYLWPADGHSAGAAAESAVLHEQQQQHEQQWQQQTAGQWASRAQNGLAAAEKASNGSMHNDWHAAGDQGMAAGSFAGHSAQGHPGTAWPLDMDAVAEDVWPAEKFSRTAPAEKRWGPEHDEAAEAAAALAVAEAAEAAEAEAVRQAAARASAAAHSRSRVGQAAGVIRAGANGSGPAGSSSSSSKRFMFLGAPVCVKCGEVGHQSNRCTVAYCDLCKAHGHDPGACRQACKKCGRVHKAYEDGQNHCSLYQCRECRRWGHKGSQCPEVQCKFCQLYGHRQRDCTACEDCWTHHAPQECPGYCGKCNKVGHWPDNCPAPQASGQAAARHLQQQQSSDEVSSGSSGRHGTTAGMTLTSKRSSSACSSSGSSVVAPGSSFAAVARGQAPSASIVAAAAAAAVATKAAGTKQGCGSMQLLPAADEEGAAALRKVVLLDKLMAQLPQYAMALLGQDDKIAVLSRLAPTDLEVILEQPLPEQQLDKVWMRFGPADEAQGVGALAEKQCSVTGTEKSAGPGKQLAVATAAATAWTGPAAAAVSAASAIPLHRQQTAELYGHPMAAGGGHLPSASMPPLPAAAGGGAVAVPALHPQAVSGVGLLTAGYKATNSYAHVPATSASALPQLQQQEPEEDQDLNDMLGLLGAKVE